MLTKPKQAQDDLAPSRALTLLTNLFLCSLSPKFTDHLSIPPTHEAQVSFQASGLAILSVPTS